jgi:hypothetical protein
MKDISTVETNCYKFKGSEICNLLVLHAGLLVSSGAVMVLAPFVFLFLSLFGLGAAGGGASLSYTVSLQVFIM